MSEKLKALVRDYFDGKISRRDFMRQAIAVSGGLVAADVLLDRLTAETAHGAEVDLKDPAIRAEDVEFPGKAGKLSGYAARPSAQENTPPSLLFTPTRN